MTGAAQHMAGWVKARLGAFSDPNWGPCVTSERHDGERVPRAIWILTPLGAGACAWGAVAHLCRVRAPEGGLPFNPAGGLQVPEALGSARSYGTLLRADADLEELESQILQILSQDL